MGPLTSGETGCCHPLVCLNGSSGRLGVEDLKKLLQQISLDRPAIPIKGANISPAQPAECSVLLQSTDLKLRSVRCLCRLACIVVTIMLYS
jgi:hypothetical protein